MQEDGCDPFVHLCLLRQPELTAKHAGEVLVDVTLDADDGELRFAVTDDGPGFDPATRDGRGRGLVGMADRGAIGRTTGRDP